MKPAEDVNKLFISFRQNSRRLHNKCDVLPRHVLATCLLAAFLLAQSSESTQSSNVTVTANLSAPLAQNATSPAPTAVVAQQQVPLELGQPDVNRPLGLAPPNVIAIDQDGNVRGSRAEEASDLAHELLLLANMDAEGDAGGDAQDQATHQGQMAALEAAASGTSETTSGNSSSSLMTQDSNMPPIYRSQPKEISVDLAQPAAGDLTTAAGKKKKTYKISVHKVKHKKKKKNKKKKKLVIIVEKKKRKHKKASHNIEIHVEKAPSKARKHHHHYHAHSVGGKSGASSHSGGHGKFYQFAEVPKKGAWKMGFKRGNEKHLIERNEHGHKSHFKTEFKWHDKKGKGKHIWDYNHHDKNKKKKHYHAAAASNDQPTKMTRMDASRQLAMATNSTSGPNLDPEARSASGRGDDNNNDNFILAVDADEPTRISSAPATTTASKNELQEVDKREADTKLALRARWSI